MFGPMTDQELNGRDQARCRDAAYRYLSYRPRSRAEVAQKLKDKGFAGHLVDAVLRDLDRLGYVNDREFALQWTRARIRLRGFGRRRIEHELKGKGVAPELIQDALSEAFGDASELDIALREADRKMKTLGRYEPDVRRRRVAGMLERRGFPAGIIRAVVKALED